uniref:Uncharacterized protein n=1 Tax=Chromera velia CCMP2878 TaxID=1169474 RepID=A0A0G4H934_9ALVE|eukprot:Cvel_25302.t1-p1 / transcript=Cvel_25302.t1 / gene=Cvel_25302 / organism=Chromera_velia_CCMP2878 / gene_product=Myosin-14, putative / transcript_product=Myosin-14, putative / location=Cvel_scaffold2847:391-4377(-) / protein_length=478 / sequence_SO=supercontig / SO=protein_coding / is_pseudo=false
MDLFGKAGLGKATDSVPVRGGFSVDAPGVAHGESRKVLLPTSRSPVVSPTSVSVFGDRGGAGELQSLIAASALTGSTTAIGGGGGGGRAESKFVSSQQTPQGVTVNTSGDSRLDYLVDRLYSLENRISRAEDSLRASRDEVKTGRAETASDLRSLSELVQSGQSRAEEGRKAVEGSVSALSAEIREVRQQAQEGVALATEGSRSASERIEAVLARLERCERDGGALASLGQTLQGGMQSVEKNADGLAERLRLLEQRFASREETVQGLSEGQRDLGRAVRDICGDVEGLRTMVVNLNGTVVGGLRAEVESLCRDLAAVRERSEVANAEVIILRNEVVAGHQQAKAGEERMGEAVQEVDTRLRRHIAEKNDVTLQRIGGVQSEVRGLLDRLEARVDSRLEAVQQRQREASDTFSSALLEVRALMKEMEDSSERRESSLCGNIEGLQKTIEGLQGNLKILQEARERMEEERKWTDDRVSE